MGSYRRTKKEDSIRPSKKEMSIGIGSVNDSFESLQRMCNDKSNELIKSIDLNAGEEMEVVFWTADIPELICVSKITKNKSGMLSYRLDFTLSTL